jgi:transposase
MGAKSRFSPEARERALRLVAEHTDEPGTQWAAIRSVSARKGNR